MQELGNLLLKEKSQDLCKDWLSEFRAKDQEKLNQDDLVLSQQQQQQQ